MASWLVMLMITFHACKSKSSHNITITPPPVMGNQQDLSEERVIQIAKDLLGRTRKTVPIQKHYWQTVIKKIPCSPYDAEYAGRCSAPEIGAPYGYKTVPQQEWTCCERVDYAVYNTIGVWSAEYSQQEDNWKVKYEFNAEQMKYYLTWIVDDNGGQITEKD